jgi:protein phosphatase slingshot
MDNEPQTDKTSSIQKSSSVISKRKGTRNSNTKNMKNGSDAKTSSKINKTKNHIRRRSTSSQQFKNHQYLITQNILHPHDKVQLIEKLVSSKTPSKFRYLVVICRGNTHALLGIDLVLSNFNAAQDSVSSISSTTSSQKEEDTCNLTESHINLPTSRNSQNDQNTDNSQNSQNVQNSPNSSSDLPPSFSQFSSKPHVSCTLGLVVPIWSHMEVNLNGDGGFALQCNESRHEFTPVSVHGLWSVIQKVSRCIQQAQKLKHYLGSGAHTWTLEYTKKVNSDKLNRAEWEYLTDLWSSRTDDYFTLTANMDPGNRGEEQNENLKIRQTIRAQLKAVMRTLDLEEVSSKDVRDALQARMEVAEDFLSKYSKFIDTEMLTVLGQMEASSQILPYLYLGSEWNAANKDELLENNIGFILNVTQEIDNFFPEDFEYKTIRLHDISSSNLSPFFNETYEFIEKAKNNQKSCLVHCKMGISRSAATVIAYLMKIKEYDIGKATRVVREKRPIIAPNEGFQRQLFEYDGILRGSRCVRKFESAMSFHGTTDHNPNFDRETSFGGGKRECWSDDDTTTTENTNSDKISGLKMNFKKLKNGIGNNLGDNLWENKSKSTRSVQTIINEYENRCASAMEINYNTVQNFSESSDETNQINSSERTYLSRSHSLPSSPKKRDTFRKRYCSKQKYQQDQNADLEKIKSDFREITGFRNTEMTVDNTEIPENTLMEITNFENNSEFFENTEIIDNSQFDNSQLHTLIDGPTLVENSQLHTLIDNQIDGQIMDGQTIDGQTIDGFTIDGFQLDTLPLDSTQFDSLPFDSLTQNSIKTNSLPLNKKMLQISILSDEDCSSSAMSATTDSVGRVRQLGIVRSVTRKFEQPKIQKSKRNSSSKGVVRKLKLEPHNNNGHHDNNVILEIQDAQQIPAGRNLDADPKFPLCRSKSATELLFDKYKNCTKRVRKTQRSVLSDTQYQYPIMNL